MWLDPPKKTYHPNSKPHEVLGRLGLHFLLRFLQKITWLYTLRIQVSPKEGISPIILFWWWDWNPQSYSIREVSGFLGMFIIFLFFPRNISTGHIFLKLNPWMDPWVNTSKTSRWKLLPLLARQPWIWKTHPSPIQPPSCLCYGIRVNAVSVTLFDFWGWFWEPQVVQ